MQLETEKFSNDRVRRETWICKSCAKRAGRKSVVAPERGQRSSAHLHCRNDLRPMPNLGIHEIYPLMQRSKQNTRS